MIPSKLNLENFCAHENTTIDFSKFESAIIIGKINQNEMESNGAGKTTIFNAIRFVLFGYSKTDLDQLIRDNTDKCKVSFEFESDKETYKIERIRSKKSGGSGVFLYKNIDGSWVDLTQRRNSDTEKDIAKLIKINLKTFNNSIYFSQNDISGLSTLTPAQRKSLLKECLDLNIYAKYEVFAKKKLSELTKELEKKQVLIETYSNLQENLNSFKESISSNELLLSENIKLLNESKQELLLENQKLQDLQIQYKILEDSAFNFKSKQKSLREDLSNLEYKNSNLKLKLNSLKQEGINLAESLKSTIDSFNNKKEELGKIDCDKCKESIEELNNSILNTNVKLKSLHNKIKELSVPLPTDSKCNHCRQILTEEHRQNCQKEIDESIIFVKKEIEDSNSNLIGFSKSKKSLEEELSKFENLTNSIKNLDFQIKKAKSDLDEKRNLYKEYTDMFNLNNENFLLKQKELSDLTIPSEEESKSLNISILNVKEKINSFQRKSDELARTNNNILSSIAVLNHKIEDCNKSIENSKTLREESKELSKKIELHQSVVQSFGSSGIPTLIVHTILDELQSKTNEFQSKLRPGLQVRFNIVKENQEDTFEIMYYLNGIHRDYEQLSGAQQLLVSLSFKLALSSIIQKRIGTDIKFLLLDEVDQSLDKKSIETFVDIIKILQKEFKVLIITHNDSLKDKFKTYIVVEQDANGISSAILV